MRPVVDPCMITPGMGPEQGIRAIIIFTKNAREGSWRDADNLEGFFGQESGRELSRRPKANVERFPKVNWAF